MQSSLAMFTFKTYKLKSGYFLLLSPEFIYTSKFLKTLLYQESDLLDVRMVVQKARKQGTVLLQWGFIEFYN